MSANIKVTTTSTPPKTIAKSVLGIQAYEGPVVPLAIKINASGGNQIIIFRNQSLNMLSLKNRRKKDERLNPLTEKNNGSSKVASYTLKAPLWIKIVEGSVKIHIKKPINKLVLKTFLLVFIFINLVNN